MSEPLQPPTLRLERRFALVVSPDSKLSEQLSRVLKRRGAEVETSASFAASLESVGAQTPTLVLIDLAFGADAGVDLVERIHEKTPEAVVLVLAGGESLEAARMAIRRGAFDLLRKPIIEEILLRRIDDALGARKGRSERLDAPVATPFQGGETLAALHSHAMKHLGAQFARIAAHGASPVLVTGETGVGKGVIVQMLHELSPRAAEPYLSVRCTSSDEQSLAYELFGHEAGVPAGNHGRRRGLLEQVGRGTLLLDEVSELPAKLQSALVRVLESGEFMRVGGAEPILFNGRLAATTNRNLPLLVYEGRFREDLYFRLSVMELHVPPLRERVEDVETLAAHFCENVAGGLGAEASLSRQAVETLKAYPWPGNVRELKNVIERSIVLSGGGVLEESDIRFGESWPQIPAHGVSEAPARYAVSRQRLDLPQSVPAQVAEGVRTLAQMEADYIQRVLDACEGNRTQASRVLGIARSTLLRKIESYGLEVSGSDEGESYAAGEER